MRHCHLPRAMWRGLRRSCLLFVSISLFILFMFDFSTQQELPLRSGLPTDPNMLLTSTLRHYRSITIFLTLSCFLLVLLSCLPYTPWSIKCSQVSLSPIDNQPDISHLPPLPSAYLPAAPSPTECEKQLGTLFLQDASNTAVNYCDNASSSSLTCFRTHASTERIDSFCIGFPAVFDPEEMRFRLGCALSVLTKQQEAAGIPALAQFPWYWYETGPRTILDRHVKLEPGANTLSSHTEVPKNFTILVRREGPSPINNLFHHFMQIFSVFLTLDVLQTALNPVTGNPLFREEDIDSTRVLIMDDHDEGPFFDQWTAFAKRPLQRIGDLRSDPAPAPENIIIPLPGSANILWQDDWTPNHCGQSKLVQVFSQRMLSFYGINDEPGARERPIVLTFIDRTEKRSLIHKEAYINSLKNSYPNVEINIVNFAALPFAEQVRTVRNTDILAGVHGAGLTHGMFLRPLSAVVEIMPPNFNHKGFRNLARFSGLLYFTTHAVEHANYTTPGGWQTDDVFIEQERFDSLIGTAIKSMYHRGLRHDDVN